MNALVLGDGGGLQNVISALHLGWEGAVVAHSRVGREATELCRRLRPEVVIIDCDGADAQWLDAVREAREAGPAAIIVFSGG